jgi:hypothetical protein
MFVRFQYNKFLVLWKYLEDGKKQRIGFLFCHQPEVSLKAGTHTCELPNIYFPSIEVTAQNLL